MSKIDQNKKRDYSDLSLYLMQMLTLHIHVCKNEFAPHKPILLLSIIDLIDKGELQKNQIVPNKILIDSFKGTWHKYVKSGSNYTSDLWKPFWHMKTEPFWHLVPSKHGFNLDNLVEPGGSAKASDILANIEYASLDSNLFAMLQNKNCRVTIKNAIVETYLN